MPFTVLDVVHMGQVVAEERARLEAETAEYERRVREFEVCSVVCLIVVVVAVQLLIVCVLDRTS